MQKRTEPTPEELQSYFTAAQKGNKTTLTKFSTLCRKHFSEQQKTALMYCCENSHVNAARIVVEKEKTLRNAKNYSALMAAARSGCLPLVQGLILEADQSLSAPFDALFSGEFACQIALRFSNIQIAEILLLKEPSAGLTDLHIAAFEQKITPQKQLIFDSLGRTPLMYAAMNSANPNLQKFVKSAGKYARIQDENGFTALMHAVFCGNLPAVRELGSEIGVQSKCAFEQLAPGFTALMLAGHLGREMAYFEVLCGEKNIVDCNGFAAVDYAQNSEILAFLADENDILRLKTYSAKELNQAAFEVKNGLIMAKGKVVVSSSFLGQSGPGNSVISKLFVHSGERMQNLVVQDVMKELDLKDYTEMLDQVRNRQNVLKQLYKAKEGVEMENKKDFDTMEKCKVNRVELEENLKFIQLGIEKLKSQQSLLCKPSEVDQECQFDVETVEKAVEDCDIIDTETIDFSTNCIQPSKDKNFNTELYNFQIEEFTAQAVLLQPQLKEKHELLSFLRQNIETESTKILKTLNRLISKTGKVSIIDIKKQIDLLNSFMGQSLAQSTGCKEQKTKTVITQNEIEDILMQKQKIEQESENLQLEVEQLRFEIEQTKILRDQKLERVQDILVKKQQEEDFEEICVNQSDMVSNVYERTEGEQQ